MAVIPLKSFTGETPRTPAHLLADNAAQSAINCDLAYGEVKGLKQQTAFRAMSSSVGSFFTDDGSNFYIWPGQVDVVPSPVIGDIHKRLYYTLNDVADIRVLARTGTSGLAQPPSQTGVVPTGYKLGVPGPSHAMFLGASELNARLINYDTAATDINLNGYAWKPVVDGLSLKIKFFYEHEGARYQEVDVPNIYDGAYATAYNPAVPFCAMQLSNRYAGDSDPVLFERIYGRDFHVAIPLLSFVKEEKEVISTRDVLNAAGDAYITETTTEVVVTKKATPAEAKPVLQVTGTVNKTQEFTIYSEGSSFSSTRGLSGAKLFTTLSTDGGVLYCGLKYGPRETHAYVYTHVNVFGEESNPSNPVLVDLGYGQTIELYGNFTQTGCTSTGAYAPIESLRTYGTNTTSQGNTDYYFVSEGRIVTGLVSACATIAFSGSQPKRPGEFGERINTIDYALPPAGATGLCALPNGFFACHLDTDQGTSTPGKGQNEVWFSEPYHPNAWPSNYVISFPWAVVGIKPQANGLVVITKGNPYFVYGTHPGSITSIKVPAIQAGISHRAIVDVGPYVVYASNDGLVAVSNTDVNLELSQKFFTRDTWRALYGANLAHLVLASHDGFLVGYFTNGAQGFVIRMDEAAGSYTRASITASCHFVSAEADLLYMGSGSTLSSFGTGARQSFTWHSKDFVLPAPTCFGAGQIILDGAESGTAQIDVYADGVLKSTTSMTDSGIFRLPSGFAARRWSVKITGARTVKELYLANAIGELANV